MNFLPSDFESVPCDLCGADAPEVRYRKNGFTIVQCAKCGMVYTNPRLKGENCDLCANNTFGRGYSEGAPVAPAPAAHATGGMQLPVGADFERLVQAVTDQVMKSLAKAG